MRNADLHDLSRRQVLPEVKVEEEVGVLPQWIRPEPEKEAELVPEAEAEGGAAAEQKGDPHLTGGGGGQQEGGVLPEVEEEGGSTP